MATPALASSEDIHRYLVERLNFALRKPEVLGGELGIRMVLDHLLFLERQPDGLLEEQHRLAERGAWTSCGVIGAFDGVLPGKDAKAVASVYAEFAHRRGWLESDRVLTGSEYDALRGKVGHWAGRDRSWSDVVAEFGPPSVLLGSTNPWYEKTLGYLGEDADEPMVFFHLWNGADPGDESRWPAHDEPVLLAVRCGDDGPFAEAFVFTPSGRRWRDTPAT